MTYIRRKLFILLEGWGQASFAGRALDAFLISLIVVNLCTLALATVETLYRDFGFLFRWVEAVSVCIFTLEYLARVWVSVESPENLDNSPLKARMVAIFKPIMVIDFIAILPGILYFLGLGYLVDARILRIFRMIRILKLVRYSPIIQILSTVIRAEKKAIISALVLGLVVLFLSSAVIYIVEKDAQPEKFASIPDAMWWAMATLTTVGYGDVSPVTAVGKIFGSVVMLMGIGVFGLWAGIMASGFTEEIRRRAFRVKWQMIAHCPIFESLKAHEISMIATKLRPVVLSANRVVMRKGVDATKMYFIVSGHVEAELPDGVEILSSGNHFGELGLLHGGVTSTTFITLEETRLLEMSLEAFEELLDMHPDVAEHIKEIADKRQHWFDPKIGSSITHMFSAG